VRVVDEAIFELQVLNTKAFDLDDEYYWTWEAIKPALSNWRLFQEIPGVIQIADAWVQPGLSPSVFESSEGSIALVYSTPPDAMCLRDKEFSSATELTQVLSAFSNIIESIHSIGAGYGHGGLSENTLLLSPDQGACVRFEPDCYLAWDPIGRSIFSPEQEKSHPAASDVYAFAWIIWGILTDANRFSDDRLRRDMLTSGAKTLKTATSLHWSDRSFLSTRTLLYQLTKDWGTCIPPID
jgi:hypothetical protein